MSRKNKLYLILAILILATGCTKLPDLGDGYKFDSDGEYSLQILNSNKTVMIDSHILKYAFNSTFIIAAQRPWKDPSIPKIENLNYSKRNNAFQNSKFVQYWIINKKQKNDYVGFVKDGASIRAKYSNVYGPFKKKDYLYIREKLGVPKKLQLIY